jgi:hypothetical protein
VTTETKLIVDATAASLLFGPDGKPVKSAPALSEEQRAFLERRRVELEREQAVRKRIADGETVYASDGVGYVRAMKKQDDGTLTPIVTPNTLTLRRAIPKIRGKATRKALKRERQRVANRTLRRQGELEAKA